MKFFNKDLIILITFLIFVFISCKKNVLGPQENNSYFPMKVGNSWTYADRDTFTLSIVGTKNINNHEYYVFTSTKNFFLFFADTAYYRQNTDGKIFKYLPYHNKEYLAFCLAESDTNWSSLGFSISSSNIHEIISIPYGEYKGDYKEYFKITYFGGIDAVIHVDFIKGIGPIRILDAAWGQNYLLIKSHIL